VRSLPGGKDIGIVSLLGRKNNAGGRSEFSFYSAFNGSWDRPSERTGRLSFQEWLDRWHGELAIRLIEHPTYDGCKVPEETLGAAKSSILRLLSEDRTVILIDSGGMERTEQVCTHMGFIEDFGSH